MKQQFPYPITTTRSPSPDRPCRVNQRGGKRRMQPAVLAFRALCLLAVTLWLTGCGAPAVPSPTPVPPTATPTLEAIPTVTLTVWDQFERPTERALVDYLNTRFEAVHPGVKIKRVVKSFDDLRASVEPALTDSNGPDVIQVNQGADMRVAVRAGRLLDLSPYLTRYNWGEQFSPGTLARNSFSADGSRFGAENLYGVSPTAEVVGFYYNKDKFQKLGLAVPQTFAKLELLLLDARNAGEVPIMFGNLDRWPGIHIFSAIEHVMLPNRTWLDDFVYGRGGVSFATAENTRAAAKVQEWVTAGYFRSDFAGIGYERAWKLFADGQGAMMLAGSWLSADIVKIGGERFGFFLLPPEREDAGAMAVGGLGVPFCIRSGTAHADLAAEYLNWMVSRRVGELWLQDGVLPAVPVHDSRIPTGTLLGDIVSAYSKINSSDAVGHYIDWAGPTMYDVLGTATQELMALQVTPQDFVARIQSEFETAKRE